MNYSWLVINFCRKQMAAIREIGEGIDFLLTKVEDALVLFLVFCNYIHTMNTDVLMHTWAQTTKYWGHSEFSFPSKRSQTPSSERIMSKNDVFLFWCFSSAAVCKFVKMESNRQLTNDVCRLGHPPPSQQIKDLIKTGFSHTLKHLQHKTTKSLFWCRCIVHVYDTHVCDMHSIHEGDKPARQETRPLQASSFCDVNTLKLRLPSTFLWGFYFMLKCPSSHFQHTDKVA